jgi:hypothetical protein
MIGMNEARELILYANFLQPGREGHDRGSAHVCEEMRLERLYLSVYFRCYKNIGATPHDAAPSISADRKRKDRFFMIRCGFGQVIQGKTLW